MTTTWIHHNGDPTTLWGRLAIVGGGEVHVTYTASWAELGARTDLAALTASGRIRPGCKIIRLAGSKARIRRVIP